MRICSLLNTRIDFAERDGRDARDPSYALVTRRIAIVAWIVWQRIPGCRAEGAVLRHRHLIV